MRTCWKFISEFSSVLRETKLLCRVIWWHIVSTVVTLSRGVCYIFVLQILRFLLFYPLPIFSIPVVMIFVWNFSRCRRNKTPREEISEARFGQIWCPFCWRIYVTTWVTAKPSSPKSNWYLRHRWEWRSGF